MYPMNTQILQYASRNDEYKTLTLYKFPATSSQKTKQKFIFSKIHYAYFPDENPHSSSLSSSHSHSPIYLFPFLSSLLTAAYNTRIYSPFLHHETSSPPFVVSRARRRCPRRSKAPSFTPFTILLRLLQISVSPATIRRQKAMIFNENQVMNNG